MKLHALRQGDEAVLKQIGEGKDIMSVLCLSILLVLELRCVTNSETL